MSNSDLASDPLRSTMTGECFTVGPGVMPAFTVLHRKGNHCLHRSLTADHCQADGRVLMPCPVQCVQ
jgi:hypothetical protein